MNCSYRIAASLYTVETRWVSYVIVNTKGDKYYNNNNVMGRFHLTEIKLMGL
jgi:hypothetical protein